jgi:hypothetical protein
MPRSVTRFNSTKCHVPSLGSILRNATLRYSVQFYEMPRSVTRFNSTKCHVSLLGSILRNATSRHSVQYSLLLVPIVSQINPVHALIFHFETHFNNIFPSTHRSSKLNLPVYRFTTPYCNTQDLLVTKCYIDRPNHYLSQTTRPACYKMLHRPT